MLGVLRMASLSMALILLGGASFRMTSFRVAFLHLFCMASSGLLIAWRYFILKVKSMQGSGTEAIRTIIQPSKPKQEIHYIKK